MKLPTLLTVVLLATVVFFVAAVSRGPEPQRAAYPLGYVMGRDFTDLLANPNVTLRVVEGKDAVVFEWKSDSPARLQEVRELGEYLSEARALLERSGPPVDETVDFRTAARD